MCRHLVFTILLFSVATAPTTDAYVSFPPTKTTHLLDRSSITRMKTATTGIDFAGTTTIIAETITAAQQQDFAPAAAALFNNMKLPAGVLTAGMISIGFATRFPELPRDTPEKVFPPAVRARCAQLDRLHIVVALISVTSELIVVLWSAVEVNQLTERSFDPAYSVWDLIQRDCDLPWSGVNSHFILGIIGFGTMLGLRGYVMLLAANASRSLMISASTGTTASLCLCISIVNRGIEKGGGGIDRYGSTIIDLIVHYGGLLLKAGLGKISIDPTSPGPLQLSAFLLEIVSLFFLLIVFMTENDVENHEENRYKDDCDLGQISAILTDERKETNLQNFTEKELESMKMCISLEEERRRLEEQSITDEEEEQKELDDTDGSVSVTIA